MNINQQKSSFDSILEIIKFFNQKIFINDNRRLEADVKKGDTVQAGVIVSNSEVGMGAVSIQPFVYRLVCSNGMVVTQMGKRRTHVGRVQEAIEDSFNIYTSETQEAEDRALALSIRDNAKVAIDAAMF